MIHTFNYTTVQIKERISLLDVADEFGLKLRKAGRSYKGLCPFHNEKTPSFYIHPKKNIFKCFGCGVSGDPINLYALLNGINNGQAIYQLSQRLGVTGNRLSKEQKIVLSKRHVDRTLEKKFEQVYKHLFYYLCNLRDSMKAKANNYKEISQIMQDTQLIRYYHEKAYHEYLLDGLLAGLFEEIEFDQQIDFFLSAIGVVNNWKGLLRKQKLKGFENVELTNY